MSHVHFWLRKDPSAFDWEQFFTYVVCTLEEGTAIDALKCIHKKAGASPKADLSKMADDPNEGQALLGRKVTKPLELKGFRCRTARMGRTSGTGLGAGPRESIRRRAVEGVRATQVESCKPKWPTGKNHVAPPTEQYAMPAKV